MHWEVILTHGGVVIFALRGPIDCELFVGVQHCCTPCPHDEQSLRRFFLDLRRFQIAADQERVHEIAEPDRERQYPE
jgi:hypothetical protein